ncbi:stearoyl-CoA 9-desaturase [Burkholderia gladioli]|uniref:stearoyl-CoA 9-desaturase n=1 Tax=Burkholderia gladioli TaxID=28095 RepID=UPI00164006F8|nr:stearoyl-CoA 9-desaturase [Burkholderia gladioli]
MKNWNRFETETRESMAGLPRLIQPLLTWLTGKPLTAKESQFHLPRWLDVVGTLLLAGLAELALLSLSRQDSLPAWCGINALWILLVGLLRKIQVTHLHHAIHNRLFNRAAINLVYSHLAPALLFIQNRDEYRKEHLEHHNSTFFTTRKDADAAFLALLGFIPGRTKRELWTNLWVIIFSPTFHFLFARNRLKSTFITAKPSAIVFSVMVACGYAVLFNAAGWKAFTVAIIIPLFPLYHISALLQFLTEHAWNVSAGPVENREQYKERCWGRFCGEKFPIRRQGFIPSLTFTGQVFLWSVKMSFLHLPTRLACLVSDLPAHDWHHLAHMAGQDARDWHRSLHLREIAIAGGDKPGFSRRELWGMPHMLAHQFGWLESISCRYELPTEQSMGNETIEVSEQWPTKTIPVKPSSSSTPNSRPLS